MIGKISWNLRRGLLSSFSSLWEVVYQARRNFYHSGMLNSCQFDLPVISVGNLAFGGSGKTPLVIWLSKFFSESGLVPAIATRGYKGAAEHGHALILAKKVFRFNADYLGDEALLLAKYLDKGAVVIGKHRADNLKFYLPQINPHVILLDDGFQHLKIKRDLDIVVFDATRPLNSLRTAPLGFLREGLSSLKHAQVVILNRVDQVMPVQLNELRTYLSAFVPTDCLWAYCCYRPIQLRDINFNQAGEVEQLKSRPVMALAALANPNAFFQTLQDCGATIQDLAVFPDHHYFTKQELAPLLQKCQEHGAWLVVSEKDLVKLRRVTDSPLIRALEIAVNFTQGERELKQLLWDVVLRRPF